MSPRWLWAAWLPAAALCLTLLSFPANAGHTVLYAAVGSELIQYDVDLENGTLTRGRSVSLPANIQEAWTHPSKKFLYVAWSNGGASYSARGGATPAGDSHGISAYRVDPVSGTLTPHGKPAALPSRPIYITTDIDGTHVVTAHNEPSGLTVHRILPDGTVGEEVKQTGKLDFGIYGHQVRVDPSNRSVILVTRGNGPTATKPEDPGALKIFSYRAGMLSERQTVAPKGGFDYQIRHLEFHPSGKWDYATLERQNKLHVYRRMAEGTLSDAPIFVKDTVANPRESRTNQAASSIHVHPNGRFIYVANRAGGTVEFEGKRVFAGGENTIAVFSINQETGEPTLIQSADTRGFTPRTFALDGSGSVLAVANQSPALVRDGSRVNVVPARLTLFHIRADGKLDFTHQYDVETGDGRILFWAGIISLP
ncbi:MAG: 3-carboxymuconate cyclase [Terriglobia bacterium]|nr:MAG: 3-carboxymuconate cyclase [Terriglobia bacterium]